MKKLILMILLLFSGVTYCQDKDVEASIFVTNYIMNECEDCYTIILKSDKSDTTFIWGTFLENNHNIYKIGSSGIEKISTEAVVKAIKKLPKEFTVAIHAKNKTKLLDMFNNPYLKEIAYDASKNKKLKMYCVDE